MKSVRPFPETIRPMLEMEDVSGNELAARLKNRGFERDSSVIYRLIAGDYPPNEEHMEQIAAVLGVTPETFAEYRLWKARCDYDPKIVGWDQAIKNLQRRELDEGLVGGDEPGLDPIDLVDELTGGGEAQAESS